MDPCIGRYYSEGYVFRDTSLLDRDVFESGQCYYEVLRVIDGICLFAGDHLERLSNSLRLSEVPFPPGFESVREILTGLIRRNNLQNGNIRLVVRTKEYGLPVLYSCCIPYAYPDTRQYEHGVPVSIYRNERTNPNIKQYNPVYQKGILGLFSSANIFEVLLSDRLGNITEGSRSNVFFIRHETVFTAPGDTVLKGITRQKIFSVCNKLNYNIFEILVSIDSLKKMQSVFLTGTSPKVLPVCKINDLQFPVDNPMMRRIMAEYDNMILQYMEENR